MRACCCWVAADDGFGDRFPKLLTRLHADRDEREAFRVALSLAGEADFAVDFSAFTPTHVADAVGVLSGRVGHYIFISTNSVYQSDQHIAAEPYDEAEAFELPVPPSRRDAYGWDKRACEELLVACAASGGMPSTRLRIPAICGPGDPTQRWWRYLLWLRSGHPVYSLKGGAVGEGRLPSYSACYSMDVVQAVLAVVKAGEITFGEVYHICAAERLTLPELLAVIAGHSPGCIDDGSPRCVVLGASSKCETAPTTRIPSHESVRPLRLNVFVLQGHRRCVRTAQVNMRLRGSRRRRKLCSRASTRSMVPIGRLPQRKQ
eukprot:SAG25_NODE_16_length_24288_cov_31.926950_5_plen_318_part_00